MKNQIIGVLPDILENRLLGIEKRQDLLDKINRLPYIEMDEIVNFDITHALFVGKLLLMDMYALGRMTKPYNKNVVVLAGSLHIKNYLNFFTKNGFTIKWNGKPHSISNVSPVPSFTEIEPWHRRLGRFLGFRGGKPPDLHNRCRHTRKAKKCVRRWKTFSLPRKFTRKQCMEKRKQGYSMKASCAP